jgi:hypothetical protein
MVTMGLLRSAIIALRVYDLFVHTVFLWTLPVAVRAHHAENQDHDFHAQDDHLLLLRLVVLVRS